MNTMATLNRLPCPKNLSPKKENRRVTGELADEMAKQARARQRDTNVAYERTPNFFITLPQNGRMHADEVVAIR